MLQSFSQNMKPDWRRALALLLALLLRFDRVLAAFRFLTGILSPFLIGGAMAFYSQRPSCALLRRGSSSRCSKSAAPNTCGH